MRADARRAVDAPQARVPGSVARISSVPRVSTEIGLKQRLPQNFSQMSLRISGRIGAFSPADANSCESFSVRSVLARFGSPNPNLSPSMCLTIPGAITSVAG